LITDYTLYDLSFISKHTGGPFDLIWENESQPEWTMKQSAIFFGQIIFVVGIALAGTTWVKDQFEIMRFNYNYES